MFWGILIRFVWSSPIFEPLIAHICVCFCISSVYMLLQDYHYDEAQQTSRFFLPAWLCVVACAGENYTEISHLRECYCQHCCPYLKQHLHYLTVHVCGSLTYKPSLWKTGKQERDCVGFGSAGHESGAGKDNIGCRGGSDSENFRFSVIY